MFFQHKNIEIFIKLEFILGPLLFPQATSIRLRAGLSTISAALPEQKALINKVFLPSQIIFLHSQKQLYLYPTFLQSEYLNSMTKRFYFILFLVTYCIQLQAQFNPTSLYMPLEFQNAYNNGTRKYDGSVSSSYWQNHSDYKMKVKIDPKKKLLTGSDRKSVV